MKGDIPACILITLLCTTAATLAEWQFKAKAGDWWAVNTQLCPLQHEPEVSCQDCCQDLGYDHGLQPTKTCACYKLSEKRLMPSDDLYQYVTDDSVIRHPGERQEPI